MRLLPKSLAGQLVLILLLALVAAQGVSLFLFAGERLKAVRDIHRQNVVARTVGLVRLLQDTPVSLHGRVVTAASSPTLRFNLTETAPAVPVGMSGERSAPLVDRLSEALQLPVDRITVSATYPPRFWDRTRRDGRHHDDDDDDDDDEKHHERRWRGKWLSIAVALPDGQWLHAVTGPPPGAPRWGKFFLLSLVFTGLAVALVAVVAGRRIARPMRELGDAADRLGRGEAVHELAEAGPLETRQTIRAFNQMRTRLERYIRDRTAFLAAISHDLKTPITTLRLRAEFIEDEEMQRKILETLDEMQAMTEATLDFIREDSARDPGRPVDISALAESVVADFADTGRPVTYTGSGAVTAVCRPTSIRRALRNLIENAIAYGERARISVERSETEVRIVVEDDGPGIAETDKDRVFDPFVRLEASRSRATGGMGLGLAISRTIARAHGGDVLVENRDAGGLRAVLLLPREAISSETC